MAAMLREKGIEWQLEMVVIDISWIPFTTCDVEIVFSGCKRVYSEQRMSLYPLSFEVIMYSKGDRKW